MLLRLMLKPSPKVPVAVICSNCPWRMVVEAGVRVIEVSDVLVTLIGGGGAEVAALRGQRSDAGGDGEDLSVEDHLRDRRRGVRPR